MQILLADAKIMNTVAAIEAWTEPLFLREAVGIASELSRLDVAQLGSLLRCSSKIALENHLRYTNFIPAGKIPALMSYNGQAYKHLRADTLSRGALAFAQEHLWITSFLYGLLRPMDGIVPYRMDHTVALDATGSIPVNRFWKDILTDVLIDSVKADDNILVHLSTAEYEQLFNWKRICSEVTVVQPLFYVRNGDNLKMQAVWAKSCRGAMTRFMAVNRIATPESLYNFKYEGFEYNPRIGEYAFPHFIREI